MLKNLTWNRIEIGFIPLKPLGSVSKHTAKQRKEGGKQVIIINIKYKRREQVKTIIGYDNKMKHTNCPSKIKKNLQD